jgi:hypothetical protein
MRRMRVQPIMILTLLMISAGVVGPSASASTGDDGAALRGRVCASYLAGDIGWGVTSQNFEPEFDEFDSTAADDLQVSRTCRARGVSLVGNYGAGSGQARSETVTFYRDDHGRPGRVIHSETVVGETDGNGSFEIILDQAVRLRPGRAYWFSAQLNMDYQCCGQWQFERRNIIDGSEAIWRNPGDGFASGCIDWGTIADCIQTESSDLMFEVRTR